MSAYKRIQKGIYMTPSGNYRVRRHISGIASSFTFSSKKRAIQFYKNWVNLA